MTEKIIFFDTTLRDGEQASSSRRLRSRKLEFVEGQLQLRPDYIEAGFPFSSSQDFNSVKSICERHGNNDYTTFCALARVVPKDIDAAHESLSPAKRKRIHVFIATSQVHMKYKLRMSPEQVLEAAIKGVRYARKYTDDVEFSPEDATNSEPEFLYRVLEAVTKAGAKTVNIPDTVGRSNPMQFGKLIRNIRNNVPNIDQTLISVHCHNDLGLAVANSLAAIENGAKQVECTLHGLGERAGNAALEQIISSFLFENRKAEENGTLLPYNYNIRTELIAKTSMLLSRILGFYPHPNAPIVGRNAFRHESGIHVHGYLSNKSTYQIIKPEDFGYETELILGSRSGIAGLEQRLKDLGLEFSKDRLTEISAKFTEIAQEKEITGSAADDADLILAVKNERQVPKHYRLLHYMPLHIPMRDSEGKVNEFDNYFLVKANVGINGSIIERVGKGDGMIDALTNAIQKAINRKDIEFGHFDSGAQSVGSSAIAGTMVSATKNGWRVENTTYDSDVVRSSADSYLSCADRIRYIEGYF